MTIGPKYWITRWILLGITNISAVLFQTFWLC
jgi:hypothetical protein